MVKELEQRWKHHFGEPSSLLKVQSKYTELKATWATLKEIVDPVNRHIRIPPAKRYHYFGKDIKDDGSLPYRNEYLNKDPVYIRDMKIQHAEQSLLGVAHAAAQVLEYPDAKLHDQVGELRDQASSLLKTAADRLRAPNTAVVNSLGELKKGAGTLVGNAIEAAENPENEISFMLQNAKENLAVLFEHYAKQLDDSDVPKKLLTHPPLWSVAQPVMQSAKTGA
jgi:hypothetical protein